MRAAIYCRISLDRTGEELGVTRQLEDCRELVADQGWTTVDIYTDNDISASSGKVRPEYRRMLAAVEAGEVDVIVAWAPDRIYRRLADLEELITVIDKRNVAIRTVKAGEFDLSTGMGKMLARILGSVAQGEGDIKSERWKRSVRQRREAGLPPKMGTRLFGYDEHAQIVPAEAAVIREAAARVLDGEALTRIVNNLNDRGIRTSRGNYWRFITMQGLLSNGRIAGRSTLRGATIGEGTWTPILDEDTFEAVQAALARPKAHGRRDASPRVALLVGLVFCGACDAKMTTGRRYGGKTGSRRTYRCPTLPGVEACGGVSADAEAVEEVVEVYARERLEDPRVRARLEELNQAAAGHVAELVDLEHRLTELEAELDTPGVPVAAILRAMDRTRERIGELHAASAPIGTPLPRGDWPADLARRAKLVHLVVERVTITAGTSGKFDPERVDITPR